MLDGGIGNLSVLVVERHGRHHDGLTIRGCGRRVNLRKAVDRRNRRNTARSGGIGDGGKRIRLCLRGVRKVEQNRATRDWRLGGVEVGLSPIGIVGRSGLLNDDLGHGPSGVGIVRSHGLEARGVAIAGDGDGVVNRSHLGSLLGGKLLVGLGLRIGIADLLDIVGSDVVDRFVIRGSILARRSGFLCLGSSRGGLSRGIGGCLPGDGSTLLCRGD